MKRVHFFIDNLSIGGFQRLCLDQAYSFSELGYSVAIHSLSMPPGPESRSFLSIEKDLIDLHGISIDYLSTGHLEQISKTRFILRSYERGDIWISHSLRATAVIYIASRLLRKRFFFMTEIHQLPTLSAPIQRFRRFLYAQLSPALVAYSEAVKKDWDTRVRNFPIFIRFIFDKPIEVIRNGIYLNRIPSMTDGQKSNMGSRLIFLGRNTGWKGLATFLTYAEHPSLSHFELLLMLPEIDQAFERQIIDRFEGRVEIAIGKSIASFSPREGDIHFYAAQYGGDARFIESISLNCLEMAAAGVPSVVTAYGLTTWNDLQNLGIFFECDWSDSESTINGILEVARKRISTEDLEKIRAQISIASNVHKIIQLNIDQ